ncbi:MAG: prepilin-type N-terminal cleavage/methylation domain-containing protein [Acidobacteria bacterium]|nr:prepilin-type N-terminal cleavage/methylation domain-containing protein [Acidobacteriota bacterium]
MRNKNIEIADHAPDHRSRAGFTLIELLIAMVIFLIVTSTIYGLLSLGTVSKNRASRRTDVLKNARAALHLIGRDALNAGLGYHQAGALVPDGFLSSTLGLPADVDSQRDILTSVIAGDNLFSNDLQGPNGDKTDIVAFAFRDLDFNGGDAIAINRSLSGDSADVMRLKLGNSTTANINPYDLVLVEADTTQVAVVVSSIVNNKNIDLEVDDPLNINLPRNGSGINRNLLRKCNNSIVDNCTGQISALKRFFWVSYKVKQDGTLVRITYGNNTGKPFDEQIQEFPLAYNVKDLQFTYVLENGTVTSNPAAGPDGIAGTIDDTPDNFNLIRQISVTIEVQSTENDDETGKPISIKLSGTFSARNLEYDVG